MSLRWYRLPRVVVLNPTAPVLDAARGIESNKIGAVVVQDHAASRHRGEGPHRTAAFPRGG
jgi:hypothetical protein